MSVGTSSVLDLGHAGLDQATTPAPGACRSGMGRAQPNRPRRRSAEAIPDVQGSPGQVPVTAGPTALRASPRRRDYVVNGPIGAGPQDEGAGDGQEQLGQDASAAGAVVAAVLICCSARWSLRGQLWAGKRAGPVGAAAHLVLVPQHISFPPADAMTPEEKASVGEFAGAKVDTGVEAEAFARYIAGHLEGVNEGVTYSETSAAARAEGLDPDVAADLQAKADTLFKGESLRAMLLNAYGWWTLTTIALWAGVAMVIAGIVLGIFSILGFRHAGKAAAKTTPRRVRREYATATS